MVFLCLRISLSVSKSDLHDLHFHPVVPDLGEKSEKATDGRVYSINGAYLGDDITKLPHGIYIVNGQKIVK